MNLVTYIELSSQHYLPV